MVRRRFARPSGSERLDVITARAFSGTAVKVGQSMTEVVGHTPVVRLRKVVPDGAADVYVKLEWFNPTGS